MNLILASGSKIRAQLLHNASLEFEVMTSPVNESDIKQSHHHLATAHLALELAKAKALAVSGQRSDAYVIGADQILAIGTHRFDKPISTDDAVNHLNALRGKTHQLISAVCCTRGDQLIWSHVDAASLTMRNFSNSFRDDYIRKMGNDLLTSVGAYKLESQGIQLFEKIEGDYFTILGLPLLPLLEYLRREGLLAT